MVDQVVAAVRQLVRMYCQAYHTDFFLGCSIEIPHGMYETVCVWRCLHVLYIKIYTCVRERQVYACECTLAMYDSV